MKKPEVIELKKEEALGAEDHSTSSNWIKELEKRICQLEIENAYLKELRRLQNAQMAKSNENLSLIIHNLRGSFQLNEILEAVKSPKST